MTVDSESEGVEAEARSAPLLSSRLPSPCVLLGATCACAAPPLRQLTHRPVKTRVSAGGNVHSRGNVEARVFTLLPVRNVAHRSRRERRLRGSNLFRQFPSAPKMLSFGVLSLLFLTVSAEYCYTDVESACGTNPKKDGSIPNCHAKYGAIDSLQAELQAYVNANIETSFEFLLMSTHFGNYEADREGFKGLYRKLSDKLWEEAIDLIKYITQRGGEMDLNQLPRFKKPIKDNKVLELTELNSLAKALDSQKQLADEALRIHNEAQHQTKYDAAIAHYIEEHFMESLSERVRQLAGYSNDLKNMLKERDASVSIFLFDEYLKTTL